MKIIIGHRYYVTIDNSLYEVRVLSKLRDNVYIVELFDTSEILELSWLSFNEYLGN